VIVADGDVRLVDLNVVTLPTDCASFLSCSQLRLYTSHETQCEYSLTFSLYSYLQCFNIVVGWQVGVKDCINGECEKRRQEVQLPQKDSTSFSARSLIVHFTEHRICCTTIIDTVSVQTYSTTCSRHFLLLTPCTPAVTG